MNLKQGWKWFLEAMFPAKCLICRREGKFLCTKHHKFKPAPPSRAIFQYVDEIFAAVAYDDLICQKIVESFKFRGISDIAEIMATEIVYRNKKILENSVLVPVPLHWTRKIWRGFNQAEILAQKIVEKVDSAESREILKRIEKTQQQARLSKKERIKNTENAFVFVGTGCDRFLRQKQSSNSIKNPAKFSNKQIILIDDVVASGSTLDAAAKTLKLAGFKNIKAVVFARGGKV
jgi:predicted amidophosphoribosyltransferase